MRRPTSIMTVLVVVAGLALGVTACATAPAQMDAATLQAHAGKPWDKAALINTTVELGRYRNMPVVAEFSCSDACPPYTVRIIHYHLPPDVSCASISGVEKKVPVAITVLPKTFCIPEPLVASGQYYAK